MNPQIDSNPIVKNEPEFMVVGISMRTTNKQAIEEGTIQQLWQQLLDQDILFKIPNKVNNSVMALYYDYASDKDGEYTLLIGAQVSSLDDVPEDLTTLHVPATKRAVFLSDFGALNCIVFNLWQKIWKQEEHNEIDRAYKIDYEIYDERSHNQAEALVEIHISVK